MTDAAAQAIIDHLKAIAALTEVVGRIGDVRKLPRTDLVLLAGLATAGKLLTANLERLRSGAEAERAST